MGGYPQKVSFCYHKVEYPQPLISYEVGMPCQHEYDVLQPKIIHKYDHLTCTTFTLHYRRLILGGVCAGLREKERMCVGGMAEM